MKYLYNLIFYRS